MLQSTEKLTFWPTDALLRPAPAHVTLLASEPPGLRGALSVKVLLEALSAESSVRVDVSLPLVAATRREPGREEDSQLPSDLEQKYHEEKFSLELILLRILLSYFSRNFRIF